MIKLNSTNFNSKTPDTKLPHSYRFILNAMEENSKQPVGNVNKHPDYNGMSDQAKSIQKKLDALEKGECLRLVSYDNSQQEFVTELTQAPNEHVTALEVQVAHGGKIPLVVRELKFDALVLTGTFDDKLDYLSLRPFNELHLKGDCSCVSYIRVPKGTTAIIDLQGEFGERFIQDEDGNVAKCLMFNGSNAQYVTVENCDENGLSTFRYLSGPNWHELNYFTLNRESTEYETLLKQLSINKKDGIAEVNIKSSEQNDSEK